MGKHKHETAERDAPLKRKEYEELLRPLHVELVKLQEWVKATGAKICIVFEGRDTAGKGGVIRAMTERVSPRVFRVVALPAPSDREKTQMHFQRYMRHMPAGGEVVIFDRSWYNRAGVELVMGYCTPEETAAFLQGVPLVEHAMVESGIILIKYWLEVDEVEQEKRIRERIEDPRKTWKLTPMDIKSFSRWYDYSRARDAMFAETDTPYARWHVANANDQRRCRLNVIAHMLSQIPYEEVERSKVKLPDRQKPHGYQEPELTAALIPTPY